MKKNLSSIFHHFYSLSLYSLTQDTIFIVQIFCLRLQSCHWANIFVLIMVSRSIHQHQYLEKKYHHVFPPSCRILRKKMDHFAEIHKHTS